MIEEWRKIPGFEDYEVSNLGTVKSLKFNKEKILKPSKSNEGYFNIILAKNKERKSKSVHQLVAITFLNHTPNGHKIVVDHIDNNKENNRVDNLQLITTRENVSKDKMTEFTGVQKDGKKFKSVIRFDGCVRHLGMFDTQEEASEYYQNAIKSLENGTEIIVKRSIHLKKQRYEK